MKQLFYLNLLILYVSPLFAQPPTVPAVYSNIFYDDGNRLYFQKGNERFYADTTPPKYSITQMLGKPAGTADGVDLDFENFKGSITYGIIPYGQMRHPLPVYRFTKSVSNGKVSINIKRDFRDPYDWWAGKKAAS